MKLEETQSIKDIYDYVNVKEKWTKEQVYAVVGRMVYMVGALNSTAVTNLMFMAWSDGKIGEPEDLKSRFSEWMVKNEKLLFNNNQA